MGILIRVPAALLEAVDERYEFEVEGQTLGEVLEDIKGRFPSLHRAIFDPRRVQLFLNGSDVTPGKDNFTAPGGFAY